MNQFKKKSKITYYMTLNDWITSILIVVMGSVMLISIMTFFSIPYPTYQIYLYFAIALVFFNLILTKEDIAFIQKN